MQLIQKVMIELGEPFNSSKDKRKTRVSFSSINVYLKTQLALMAGSLADFLVTILLVQVFNCWYLAGNAAGNVTGAIFQFILSP